MKVREETAKGITALTNEPHKWWLLVLLILALKLVLLALDPLPKMFMGDSACYIATAIVGWIPDDRSYFYGYVIWLVSLWTESLTPLLLLQTVISALTALLLAYSCWAVIGLSVRSAYVIGFVCALDPFQLVWERYVMTETISLFFYVAGLYFSFLYLRDRRIRHLAIVQGLWLILIGFRMSYLLLVQISTILLPIVAFTPLLFARWRNRHGVGNIEQGRPMRSALVHLACSISIMLVLHGTYKQINGLLCGRPPAYLYATGLHLLAFWAPMLVPADATDPRLAKIIEEGNEFGIKDVTLRNCQRFESGHLVTRWQKLEPDVARANQIAKETAMRALRRDPLRVIRLTVQTFAQYWNLRDLRYYATQDLGHNDLTDDQILLLAERFHFATDGKVIGAPPTLLQRYFLLAWPYCYFLILSPIIGIWTLYRTRQKQMALLLLAHLVLILTVTFTFAVAPSFRYLQPVSIVVLLTIALGLQSFLSSRLCEQATVPQL